MMVNGDPTQTDLAPGQTSGLSEAIELLSGLDRVGHVRFRHGDVVRHDLVRQIVEAYESAKPKPSTGATEPAMSAGSNSSQTSPRCGAAPCRRASLRARRSPPRCRERRRRCAAAPR